MNIKKWWDSLEYNLDKNKPFKKRDKPLTWKELFFRDKLAVFQTIFTVVVILTMLVWMLI